MQHTSKLLTVRDVMQRIPLGKTRITAIVNTLPHINTGGKLLVDESYVSAWIALNTKRPGQPDEKPRPKKRRPMPADVILTDDGKIPTRKQLQQILERQRKEKRKP